MAVHAGEQAIERQREEDQDDAAGEVACDAETKQQLVIRDVLRR
jgi:hypothetical protein